MTFEPVASSRRLRLFVSQVEEPRSRRATDAIGLVASAVGYCFVALLALPPSSIERAITELASTLPGGLAGFWQLIIAVLIAVAVVVPVAAVVRNRLGLLRDIGTALLLTLALCLVGGRLVQGAWEPLWTTPPDDAGTWGLVGYLTMPATALLTAAPHLAKPVRRLAWWLALLAALAAVMLGAAPSAVVAAMLIASLSSNAMHLVFGSPKGRPSLSDVSLALASLGVRAHSLGVAERQSAGLYVVEATSDEGERLLVKVYGRDAYDTQLLATAWRSVWYREAGSPVAFGRRQQVEREAFLTLLARQAGVLTETVVAAGITQEDDAVLVLKPSGEPLSTVPNPWPDELVRGVWRTVHVLHDTAICHGQLDDIHLITDSAGTGVVDFRGGEAGLLEERFLTDRAQLLVTTAFSVGMGPAAQGAMDALGPDGLEEVLPYIQTPSLTPRQRQQVRAADLDLDELRNLAAHAAGIEPPELRRLRRVTIGSLLQAGLLVIAFLALSSAFAGLDLADLADQLQSASWPFILIGAMVAQMPRLAQAVSTLGAAPIKLPLRPVYTLQLAQSYLALAVPASAARVALNVRFFQRHGLSAGSALAIGAIDGFAGFIIQATLLISLLLLTSTTLDVDLGASAPSGLGQLVLVMIGLSVLAAAVLLLTPRWRTRLFDAVRATARDATEAVRGIRSPRRIGLLLGGNLAAEILFAVALGAIASGFGYRVGLTELLLINMIVSLLAGLLPIPGGIGVVEGGLMLGLVSAGVPEETAFAIVIVYRLATFYLPPIWGFFALRWLERNRHL